MNRDEIIAEKKNIYESMAAVMEDCGAVAKNDKNPQQGYKYRGIDAVMNALNPALRKNHVFVVPEVLEQTREERQTTKGATLIYSITKVRYTFYAEDGSNVSAVVIGEGMDSGDKSMNKAMSAAFKYACFQTLCIPTEEMRDSEEETHEVIPREEANAAARRASLEMQLINPVQAASFEVHLKDNGVDPDKVLDYYHIDTFEKLTYKSWRSILDNMKKAKEVWGYEPSHVARSAD